jgi:hypothetical protein
MGSTGNQAIDIVVEGKSHEQYQQGEADLLANFHDPLG